MGKTFKRNSQFRPKKQGKTFVKDNSWKKNKFPKNNIQPENESIDPNDYKDRS